jgi:hypothetical protein
MRSKKESALRACARKLGHAIHKSRSRWVHEDNLGKCALVKEDTNYVCSVSVLMMPLSVPKTLSSDVVVVKSAKDGV